MIDAIVTGRSLPALQSALDLAEVGLRVVLLHDSSQAGARPCAERDPDGVIADFLKRIAAPVAGAASSEPAAAAKAIAAVAAPPMLLHGTEWLRQASPNVLGIPAVAIASETIAMIGSGGAFRAYLDRITPLLTVGKTQMLGELVRKRMGAKVRDRLVDPQVFERYGAESAEVEVAVATPGLNEALSRAGSLSTAVLAYAERNVARETRLTPALGTEALVRHMLQLLELYGVEVRSEQAISIVHESDCWQVQIESGDSLHARAIVADVGESAIASEVLLPIVAPVMPSAARVYASIDINRPEWLAKGDRAVARVDDWAIVIDASLEVKGEGGADEPPTESERQTLTGDVICYAVSAAAAVGEHTDLLDRLQAADASSGVISGKGIVNTLGCEAPISGASLFAAPFKTIAQRHEAADALASLEAARPDLIAVGRAAHGDDQAAALSAAHDATVRLRRRLLGLAE